MTKPNVTSAEIASRAIEFADRLQSGDVLEEFETFAEFARDERFKAAFRVAWTAKTEGPKTTATLPAHAPARRSPRIRWRTPKGAERARANKAWTAKAASLPLKVERAELPEGVVFRAFVGSDFVGQDRLMSNAQSIAADEAIKRLRAA